MYQYQKDNLTKQMEESLAMLSKSRAESLEDFLYERKSNLEYLAVDLMSRTEEAEDEEILEELQSFQAAYPYFFDVAINSNQQLISTDNKQDIHKIQFESLLQDYNGTLPPLLMLSTFEPTLVLSENIYNQSQEKIGVLAGFLEVNELRKNLNHTNFTDIDPDHEDYAFLVNLEGEFISHPNKELVLHNNYFEMNDFNESVFRNLVEEGNAYFNPTNDMIQSFYPVSTLEEGGSEWFVGVSVPQYQLTNPQTSLLFTYLGLFSCVFIVTLFAVLKLSNFIVTPLEKLVIATANFTFGKKVDPLTSGYYQEVDTLSRAFKMMTGKLIEREKNHQKSTLILESTDNGVFAFTQKDKLITTFNSTCEQLFKEKRSNVLGVSLEIAASSNPRLRAFLEGAEVLKKEGRESGYECTCVIGYKEYAFYVSVSKLYADTNDGREQELFVVFGDVTEKRVMQQQLLKTEKSRVVGELAAGFAHEIRNPLSTIKGFLQLFKRDEQDDGKRDHYELMVREINRVNQIIKDLLNMATPTFTEVVREETDLNEILHYTRRMYITEAQQQEIEFVIDQHDNLPTVFIEVNKLQQIMINLVKNAIEAMPRGGRLSIEAFENEQGVIEIIFQDTGIGMDRETLNRIGTPFFTTKKDGTGLGLMTCFRIAEELGGALIVDSELEKGTTFTLMLPKNAPTK